MPLDTRLELEKLESERKTIINSLAKLESQIYDFEGSYLKETGAYGNAVKVITEFSGQIPDHPTKSNSGENPDQGPDRFELTVRPSVIPFITTEIKH